MHAHRSRLPVVAVSPLAALLAGALAFSGAFGLFAQNADGEGAGERSYYLCAEDPAAFVAFTGEDSWGKRDRARSECGCTVTGILPDISGLDNPRILCTLND